MSETAFSNIQMVDLKNQYLDIKSEVDTAIEEILHSSQFIGGNIVKEFAANLESYLDVKHVIPCANGTDALQVALMGLGLKPGDEVITTPFTFVATAEVIALLHLTPVFVDVNPCTFMMNEYELERAITDKTRCIIPVHLFGQAANMEAIQQIASKHNIRIVEDNAQAIGADFHFSNGQSAKLGTIGDIGTTSFFPSKNLGCYGDGGAIFTNDDTLAAKMRKICNHGMEKRYYHDEIGVNSRLDAIQAAVLNIKLKKLDTYNKARQRAAAFYDQQLKDIAGITTPRVANYSTHVYHQYTLLLERGRDEVHQTLKDKGVPSGIYYPVPLHLQIAYRQQGRYKAGDFPVTEALSKKVLSLPMHSEMNEELQSYITGTLLDAYNNI